MPQIDVSDDLGRAKMKLRPRFIFRLIIFSFGLLIVAQFACKVPKDVPKTTWSATEASPNGSWLASAKTEIGGSYGGEYDVTDVYLTWKTSHPSPIKILEFDHQYPTMKLKMEWADSNHLLVSYTHANIDFQAIKCAGIEISVNEVDDDAYFDKNKR